MFLLVSGAQSQKTALLSNEKKLTSPKQSGNSTDCTHHQPMCSKLDELNIWTKFLKWNWTEMMGQSDMSKIGWNEFLSWLEWHIWKRMDSQRCWKSEQTSLWNLVWIFPPSGSTAKSKWLIVCRARKGTYQKIHEKTIHWSTQSKTNMEERIKQAILKIGQPLTA